MPSEGPNSPGTEAEDTSNGSTAWDSYTNAKASDDSRDEVTITLGTEAYRIRLTNFGFAIPAGATIDGVEVHAEGHQSDAGFSFWYSVLVKGGSIVGDEKGDVNGDLSDSTLTFGDATAMWGITLIYSDVNASNFGCVFNVTHNGSPSDPRTIRIDHISMTVHYTEVVGTVRTMHHYRQRRAA